MPTKPPTHKPPHQKTTEQARSEKKRSEVYDAAWNKLSKAYRLDNPTCARCAKEGVITFATMVHHRQPVTKKPELRLDWDNLESICDRHHAIAHQEIGEALPDFSRKKNNGTEIPN